MKPAGRVNSMTTPDSVFSSSLNISLSETADLFSDVSPPFQVLSHRPSAGFGVVSFFRWRILFLLHGTIRIPMIFFFLDSLAM